MPLPLFGLLTHGVYPFHFRLFPTLFRHCGTFKVLFHIKRLRNKFLPLTLYKVTLTYSFIKHEHYKRLSLCEHGLSSTRLCSDYMCIHSYYTINYRKGKLYSSSFSFSDSDSDSGSVNFCPKTAFSKLESLFKTS